MKKSKEEILNIIYNLSLKELSKMSFMAFRLIEHLKEAQKVEKRDREKARIKIALGLTEKWLNEYEN